MLHIESATGRHEKYILNLLNKNLFPQGEMYINLFPLRCRAEYMSQFVKIIVADGRPVGYICLSGVNEPIDDLRQAGLAHGPFYYVDGQMQFGPYIYIKQICIEEGERGKGYGQKALAALGDGFKGHNLLSSVNGSNQRSMRAHLRCGFRDIGGYTVEFKDVVLGMRVLLLENSADLSAKQMTG